MNSQNRDFEKKKHQNLDFEILKIEILRKTYVDFEKNVCEFFNAICEFLLIVCEILLK